MSTESKRPLGVKASKYETKVHYIGRGHGRGGKTELGHGPQDFQVAIRVRIFLKDKRLILVRLWNGHLTKTLEHMLHQCSIMVQCTISQLVNTIKRRVGRSDCQISWIGGQNKIAYLIREPMVLIGGQYQRLTIPNRSQCSSKH